MKKIIAFLILLLCLKQSYAQYPLKQYLGSDSTLVTVRGGMNARLVLWSFTDTTQANTQRISQYAGALIYTTGTDKVWYRNSTATGWIEFTSSGGTTTNLYNSDGFITGTRVLDLSASPLTFSRSGVKQFAAEDNLTTIGSPNNQKRITVYNDSITILGLSQTTDTTTYKPLAIDADGYFTIMDRWPGGGGSSGWALTGNAGTDAATNFIGTTDSTDLVFKSNNAEIMRLKRASTGRVGIGTSNPAAKLNVLSTTEQLRLSYDATNVFRITVESDGRTILWPVGSNAQLYMNGFVQVANDMALYGTTTWGIGRGGGNVATNVRLGGALGGNTTGSFNTAIGNNNMPVNTTGEQNTSLGANSLLANTIGSKNTSVGAGAMEGNTEGSENVAVGSDALLDNTTGIRNIGIGWNGFANNFTGGQNIGIGYGAGKTITNGNNNTILGAFAAWDAAQNDTITGAVIIGHAATASEDSTVVLGDDYIKKTHLKGVVYAPFTTGDATTSDSALVVDRSTGAFIMRPVAGGGSYTFTNGLTDSSGTVKLGGTLTEATTINANTETLFLTSGTTETASIYFDNGQVDIYGNKNGAQSGIIVKGDSLWFQPLLGRMNIDTLATASNMTNKKVMTWDTVTKRWEQIAKDSVGGSGGTPAGSTKQIQYNNAGSFGGAAGFEYQAAASPNVLVKGQDKTYIPLIVKGIDSSQTADLFRVSRYEDSAMFRVAANGSVTIGPAYDYANAAHAPGHEFRYSNSGYTGGIKILNHQTGSIVRLQTLANGLYLTDNSGTAASMTLGTRTNPADASTFIAASGTWTISSGRLGIGGTAHASAQLDASSTTKGFLPPRMTGTQAEAISSPAEGLMVYATDGSGSTITSKGWWGYDGSTWVKLN